MYILLTLPIYNYLLSHIFLSLSLISKFLWLSKRFSIRSKYFPLHFPLNFLAFHALDSIVQLRLTPTLGQLFDWLIDWESSAYLPNCGFELVWLTAAWMVNSRTSSSGHAHLEHGGLRPFGQLARWERALDIKLTFDRTSCWS